jgi:hypothetical protein
MERFTVSIHLFDDTFSKEVLTCSPNSLWPFEDKFGLRMLSWRDNSFSGMRMLGMMNVLDRNNGSTPL